MCISAVLSPVLNTTLIIFDPEENGSYDEGEENVDSQLHKDIQRHLDNRSIDNHVESPVCKIMYLSLLRAPCKEVPETPTILMPMYIHNLMTKCWITAWRLRGN